jgi:hypothetical protein
MEAGEPKLGCFMMDTDMRGVDYSTIW